MCVLGWGGVWGGVDSLNLSFTHRVARELSANTIRAFDQKTFRFVQVPPGSTFAKVCLPTRLSKILIYRDGKADCGTGVAVATARSCHLGTGQRWLWLCCILTKYACFFFLLSKARWGRGRLRGGLVAVEDQNRSRSGGSVPI